MNQLQKKRPADVRAKISQSLKNRTLPDSVKDKISQSMKRRWAELSDYDQPDQDNNNDNSIVL